MLLALMVAALAQHPSPETLVERLGSDEPAVRDDAMKALRALGAAAKPALEAGGRHRDADVAERSLHLLEVVRVSGALTPRLQRAIPTAVDRLAVPRDDRAWTQVFLEAVAIERMEPEDLDGLVERAMRGAHADELPLLMQHVSQRRLASALPHALKLVNHANAEIAGSAISVIYSVAPRELGAAVADLVSHEDKERRKLLTNLLYGGTDPSLLPAIGRLLTDKEEEIASPACFAMHHVPRWRSLPMLLALLRDPRAVVQVRAVRILQQMNEGRREMAALLSSPNPTVRDAVLEAYAQIPAPDEAQPVLRELARHGTSTLAAQAVRAMRVVDDVMPFLLHREAAMREAALKMIEAVRPEGMSDAVLPLLRDEDPKVRVAAAQTLAALNTVGAVPRIEDMLADAESEVRAAAVGALGALRAAGSVAAIRARLKDKDSRVRSQAIGALGVLGATDALPEVARLLADDEIWGEAAEMIQNHCWREVPAGVLDALASSDADRAYGALGILYQTRARGAAPQVISRLDKADEAELAVRCIHLLELWRCRDAAAAIRERVKDNDVEVRAAAVQALGTLRVVEAADDLVRLLTDEDYDVRQAAAEALGRLGRRKDAAALAPLIAEEDSDTRQAAMEALERLGPDLAFDAAAALAASDDVNKRYICAEMMAWFADERSAKVLRGLLRDMDAAVRERAAQVILSLKPGGAAADLVTLLKDDDPGVRAAAAGTLLRWKVKESVPAIAELLDDRYVRVRREAREVLWQMEPREASRRTLAILATNLEPSERANLAYEATRLGLFDGTAELVRAAREGDPQASSQAFERLYELAPKSARAEMIELARDPDPSRRAWAGRILGAIGNVEDMSLLMRLVADPDSNVSSGAVDGIRGMKPGAEILRSLLRNDNADVRAAAIDMCGEPADVRPYLEDNHRQVRIAAVHAIGKLQGAKSVEALRKRANDRDAMVRVAALGALATIEKRGASDVLRAAMADPSYDVREAATARLAEIGDRDAAPLIRKALDDESASVEAAACRALAELGVREAAADMQKRSRAARSSQVRLAAAESLCRLGSREGAAALLEESLYDGVQIDLLNALRAPEAWARLEKARGKFSGTKLEVLRGIAAAAGLTVELEPRAAVRAWAAADSGNDGQEEESALEALLYFWGEGVAFIIDEARLRVLQADDALVEWEDWWKK